MKHLLIVSTLFISFQVDAEIFVCKDNKNRITYQEKPCLTTMVGKLKNIPDAPIEEQVLAQDRINKANEVYRQRIASEAVARQQQEANDREIEAIEIERRKLELLERQTIAAEKAAASSRWVGGVRWWHRLGTNRVGYPRSGSHRSEASQSKGSKVVENRDIASNAN